MIRFDKFEDEQRQKQIIEQQNNLLHTVLQRLDTLEHAGQCRQSSKNATFKGPMRDSIASSYTAAEDVELRIVPHLGQQCPGLLSLVRVGQSHSLSSPPCEGTGIKVCMQSFSFFFGPYETSGILSRYTDSTAKEVKQAYKHQI